MLEQQQIERAAKIMKILHLANDPMMDTVAIKLNCQPTYHEILRAKKWAKAFELAERDAPVFELALELHKGGRR